MWSRTWWCCFGLTNYKKMMQWIFSGLIWGNIHEEAVGEWPINLETFSKKRRYYMLVFILVTLVSMCWCSNLVLTLVFMCWCPNSFLMQWKLLHYLYNDMKLKTFYIKSLKVWTRCNEHELIQEHSLSFINFYLSFLIWLNMCHLFFSFLSSIFLCEFSQIFTNQILIHADHYK